MINNVTLVGRMVAPAELRTTQSGTSVAKFTIAIERKHKSGENGVTDFIDCIAWKTTGEFISKWFKKGDFIAVQGEIITRSFTDKDGNKRKAVEINVGNASFCSNKVADAEKPAAPESNPFDFDEDELPFN